MDSAQRREAIRAIALFEGAKGLIVLVAGLGVLALVHRDLQHAANEIVRHLHLNPAKHYPQIFVHFAERVQDARLATLAAGAAAYCLVRFVEAYGLWRQRPWAEGFAAISGAVYLPFEAWKIFHGEALVASIALAINVLVVAFMIYALAARRRAARGA